jgi:uncharacterized protein YceK
MRKIVLFIITIAAAGLSGCAAHKVARQDQEFAVTVSYVYDANDQAANAWRAFMIALDKCHNDGYQDAFLVGPPAARCDRSSGNTCVHFAADASYDCVGLGYQAN